MHSLTTPVNNVTSRKTIANSMSFVETNSHTQLNILTSEHTLHSFHMVGATIIYFQKSCSKCPITSLRTKSNASVVRRATVLAFLRGLPHKGFFDAAVLSVYCPSLPSHGTTERPTFRYRHGHSVVALRNRSQRHTGPSLMCC